MAAHPAMIAGEDGTMRNFWVGFATGLCMVVVAIAAYAVLAPARTATDGECVEQLALDACQATLEVCLATGEECARHLVARGNDARDLYGALVGPDRPSGPRTWGGAWTTAVGGEPEEP